MLGKIKLGISMGDPNGIGIEIILKNFEDKRLFDFFTPIVYAPYKLLDQQKKHFGFQTNLSVKNKDQRFHKAQLNVIDMPMPKEALKFGEPSKIAGALAIDSLKAATSALKKGKIDALVTAPINKETIQSTSFNFPGHTDYLAKELEGKSLMLMVSDLLKVALVSDHIAVKDVSNLLTTAILEEKIIGLENSLKNDFNIQRPKLAVLGLNPHSGDKGVIGQEDYQIILPVVNNLFEKGHLVYGPYAADGFFGQQTHLKFDAVLAMYHDQGLIPFKMLTFGTGVNYTAGLKAVRTSPDHGTAFEIAGQGTANAESFRNAMFLARLVLFNWKEKNSL
ncbi:MAG: 4-hydroxythreonine-4-phosphate dehydrogenase PdxA [Flavobacteriaceae bacterium]|nr:4-hydroxythreonine-4-phosphate dehydrogenase PdxA [Flavobacteriaceae bacterium]